MHDLDVTIPIGVAAGRVDANKNYTCANVLGSDALNCGACGNTCDWDEKCLKGVCVKGAATSCWNTECPSGTECVSKSWPSLRNPQCRATLVDRTWCGWFGDVCESNESCELGLCVPKTRYTCDLRCAKGSSCCWVLGEKQCVDVTDNALACGSCGNACRVGALCAKGKCEPWFTVADVCSLTGSANCSTTGIDCKNLLADPGNCGRCGLECPDTGWCDDGRCVLEVEEVENAH